MAFTFIVTNAGRAALVNAANTGTAPVVIAQAGLSGTAWTPTAEANALTGEFLRLNTLSGDVVADDTIHMIVRDESTAVFAVRSLGLYLGDGTLFAVYGQGTPILEKSAQSMMLLAIDIRFEDIDANDISFGDANFLNPPATTEQIGVVELATLAESIAGLDTSRVPAAKMVKDAVFSWLDARFGVSNAGIWHPGNDGAGSGLDADLLDGQDGGYYSNIAARLGYTPVQQGTGNAQLGNTVKIGWSGSRLRASVDASDLGNVVFDGQISDVWRVSNDGAGSGLDADLLDGQQGSFYTDVPARLGYAPVRMGTGIGQVTNVVHIGWNGSSRLKGTVDGLDLGNFVFDAQIADIWRSSNDGSGSGLDSDLLDGQHGSYYSNITARLGYIPINKAGDTMQGPLSFQSAGTNGIQGGNGDGAGYALYNLQMNVWHGLGIMTYDGTVNGFYDARAGRWDVRGGYRINGTDVWHPGNDGSGSGMDADLLDGQQGSFYADIPSRLGFTPVRQGGGTGQGGNLVFIGWSGSRMKMQVDNLDLGNMVMDADIADVWRASNDGSGSGLDADLLNGYQGSDYDRVVAQSLVENGGYIVYASGRKECWGVVNIVTEDAYVTVNLPTQHDSWVLPTGDGMALASTAQENTAVRDIQYDGNGRPISFRIYNAAGPLGGFPFRWRSIGK
jgi:hypothetical protein